MNNLLEEMPLWDDSGRNEASICYSDQNDSRDPEDEEASERQEQIRERCRNRVLGQFDSIKEDMLAITHATETIFEITELFIRATSAGEEQQLENRLQSLLHNTDKGARRIEVLLKRLEEGIGGAVSERAQQDERLRESTQTAISRKFEQEMQSYQYAQVQHKLHRRDKVKRQVLHVKPDATDIEIENVLISQGGRDEWYRQHVLAGGVYGVQADDKSELLSTKSTDVFPESHHQQTSPDGGNVCSVVFWSLTSCCG